MTWVVLKIRTMPNAVRAYRLPSASPLTSSCPHGRSARMSGSTESMRLPRLLVPRPKSARRGPRTSHVQHPNRAFGEVVGDRGLGEPPSRPVPAMDPGAHPEESEGRELGVGPDERAVAHPITDDAFEQVAHCRLLDVHLPQRRRWQHIFLTEVHANRIEISQNAEDVGAHHGAQLLGARACLARDGSYLAQDLICSPLEQSNEQLLLRGHVVVEAALVEAHGIRDVLHRGGVVTLLAEDAERRCADGFLALRGPALPPPPEGRRPHRPHQRCHGRGRYTKRPFGRNGGRSLSQ